MNCIFCESIITKLSATYNSKPVCESCLLDIELRRCTIVGEKLIPTIPPKKLSNTIPSKEITPEKINDVLEWFAKNDYSLKDFTDTMKTLFIEVLSGSDISDEILAKKIGLSAGYIYKLRKDIRDNNSLFLIHQRLKTFNEEHNKNIRASGETR